MIDWRAAGRDMGLEVGTKGMMQAELPAADVLTFDEIVAWINGVLDGFEEVGRKAKGIRVSHSLIDQMRGIQDETLNDCFRGYPFVGGEKLWPERRVEIVLL